jgi:hypothetical protein
VPLDKGYATFVLEVGMSKAMLQLISEARLWLESPESEADMNERGQMSNKEIDRRQ